MAGAEVAENDMFIWLPGLLVPLIGKTKHPSGNLISIPATTDKLGLTKITAPAQMRSQSSPHPLPRILAASIPPPHSPLPGLQTRHSCDVRVAGACEAKRPCVTLRLPLLFRAGSGIVRDAVRDCIATRPCDCHGAGDLAQGQMNLLARSRHVGAIAAGKPGTANGKVAAHGTGEERHKGGDSHPAGAASTAGGNGHRQVARCGPVWPGVGVERCVLGGQGGWRLFCTLGRQAILFWRRLYCTQHAQRYS